MEHNMYKNINQISYLTTERIIALMELDLKTLKHYTENNNKYTNVEMLEVIGELELIHHILKLRNIKVLHE